MIVIARSYGQLGNRLFLYAHMIAAAREYGTSVAKLSVTASDHDHVGAVLCKPVIKASNSGRAVTRSIYFTHGCGMSDRVRTGR